MEGKTSPAQVAEGQDHLGHKYNAAITFSLYKDKIWVKAVLLYKLHLVAASCSYLYIILQLALEAFSFHQL